MQRSRNFRDSLVALPNRTWRFVEMKQALYDGGVAYFVADSRMRSCEAAPCTLGRPEHARDPGPSLNILSCCIKYHHGINCSEL